MFALYEILLIESGRNDLDNYNLNLAQIDVCACVYVCLFVCMFACVCVCVCVRVCVFA